MGTFNASLRTPGDSRALPAVVVVADNRIRIEVGEQELGHWSLDEVLLEPTGDSVYRFEAEGDHVLLDFEDAAGFRELLDETSRMRNRPKVRVKTGRGRKAETAEEVVVATAAPVTTVAEVSGFWARVDSMLESAENRWGAVLPSWVFNRATLYGIAALVVGGVLVPGIVSMVLVVAGLLTILFGAVVFTDTMLATKWLPGRMTLMHVMVIGAVLVLLGVIVGLAG